MAPALLPRLADENVTLSVGSIIAIVEGAIIFTMLVYLAVTHGCCGMCGGSRGGGGGRSRNFW